MGLEDEIQKAMAEKVRAERIQKAWASVRGRPTDHILSAPDGDWLDLVREVLPLVDWSAHATGRHYRAPDGTTRFSVYEPGKSPLKNEKRVNYLSWTGGKDNPGPFFVLTSDGLIWHGGVSVDNVKAWIVPEVAEAAVRKSSEDRAKAKSSGLTGCSVAVLLILTSTVGAFAGLLDLAS